MISLSLHWKISYNSSLHILASKTTHMVLCVTHVIRCRSVPLIVPFCISFRVSVISVRMGMCLLEWVCVYHVRMGACLS